MTANAGDRERAIRERVAALPRRDTFLKWNYSQYGMIRDKYTEAKIADVYEKGYDKLYQEAPADIAWLLDRVAELTRDLAETRQNAAATALELNQQMAEQTANYAHVLERIHREHADELADVTSERDAARTALAAANDELEICKGAHQLLREAIGLKDGQGIQEAAQFAVMRKRLLREVAALGGDRAANAAALADDGEA